MANLNGNAGNELVPSGGRDDGSEPGELGPEGAAGDLRPEQEKALAMLVAGKSVTDVAREIGVHRVTLHRWMKSNPSFAAAFNQWREQMQESAHSRLLMMAEKAADALEKTLEAGDGRLAMRYFEKMGMAREREAGPTEAEEVIAELEIEEMRRSVNRKKEAGDLRLDELQAGLLDGL